MFPWSFIKLAWHYSGVLPCHSWLYRSWSALFMVINHLLTPSIKFFLFVFLHNDLLYSKHNLCVQTALLHCGYVKILTNSPWMWGPNTKCDPPGGSLQDLTWQVQCFSKHWLVSSKSYLLVEIALGSQFGRSLFQNVCTPAVNQPRGQKAAAWLLLSLRPAELRARRWDPLSLTCGVLCLWILVFGLLMSSKLSGNMKAWGKMLPACLTSSVREKIILSQTLWEVASFSSRKRNEAVSCVGFSGLRRKVGFFWGLLTFIFFSRVFTFTPRDSELLHSNP